MPTTDSYSTPSTNIGGETIWRHIHSEVFNYFTIVVRQLGDESIYKLYARRLGIGVCCPIFILSSHNRQVVPGNWEVGLSEFKKELSKFNPPLSVKPRRSDMLSLDYREVSEHIRSRIVGQDKAMTQLEQALMLAQAGIGDPTKPLAVLFFAGPSGVGKSETLVALAEAIHGNGEMLCRVDCNLLTQDHTITSLSGSPPGYVGSVEGNTLLNKEVIEGKPGKPGILVFEEIEKAHPVIWNALLGIFDKAYLRMSNGKGDINFCNTIIVCTSNIGSRELKDAVSGNKLGFSPPDYKTELNGDERKKIVHNSMTKAFRPEFLGRIDYTVTFRWLTHDELLQILDRFIKVLNGRLLGRQLYLDVTAPAREFLAVKGYDIRYGARPLKQAVRKYLEVPMSEDICLSYKIGTKYIARKQGNSIVFDKSAIPLLEKPLAIGNPKVNLIEDEVRAKREATTTRVATMVLDGVEREVRLSLSIDESHVYDRWLPAFQEPEVSVLLQNISAKQLTFLVKLLQKVEGRMIACNYKPCGEDLAQIAAAGVMTVMGVFNLKFFWNVVNRILS